MKLNKKYQITLDTTHTIKAATIANSNEIVLLLSSGEVIRYNINKKSSSDLFSVKNSFTYSDGGFDIEAKSSIYTLDEIVVVVNDFKRHGYVHHPEKYHNLDLRRGDYHADISCYPIALFKNEENIPHIIYGADWNHLQIMNLDTRQILTAAKSLIKEKAEEEHIEFYKNHEESNKLTWPSAYDYFFGKLFLSPDSKKFLSAGWAWGSFDIFNIYDIQDFISNNRITDFRIAEGEHTNSRAFCWIDNETFAVAYHPQMDNFEDITSNCPNEIQIRKIAGDLIETTQEFQITEDVFASKLYYNKNSNCFVMHSEKDGVLLLSLNGQIIFKDKSLLVAEYKPELNLLLSFEDKTISIYEIETL